MIECENILSVLISTTSDQNSFVMGKCGQFVPEEMIGKGLCKQSGMEDESKDTKIKYDNLASPTR